MTRFYKIGVVLFLDLLLMMGAAYASVTVTMPEQVTVESANFTLADLATLTGDDEGKIRQLSQWRLGNSAAPGYSLTLTPELITMRLASSAIDLSDITWQIPSSIIVTTASQILSGSLLSDQVVAAVKQKLVGVDSEVKVQSVQDVTLPVGAVDYKITFPSGLRFVGLTMAMVPISVNQQHVTQTVVKLNITIYQSVVVTAHAFRQGEMINPADLVLERRNVGPISSYYTDKAKAVGHVLTHAMAAGTVLNDSVVAMPQVIHQGDIISLVAHNGAIEVATTGRALQNGCINQFIRVQNLQSKKILSGKVIDSHTVDVTATH
jgi:flagellar basal body P-ring formation protein FlgA